ncbi:MULTISPECIES: copper chaperone PCu(A)C [Burkholderia]|uniref:Copper transporter n=1 Tax=Burkholderia cenocepacia TaxID=95486 RepID=A0A071MJZ1_9BURK|nr:MULTISPECIES: copper chaperone PCu(A)C [Burkholderia]AOJ29221.1 copper transporter [Burkholderia seminalis]KVF52110.1 copper transporter [Burkholderia seminalis]MBJ9589562.1 copper chaperone PCu(A)C [Burkholderia seminalis]MBN3741908.1 copper chaperone PCu(A)C [Burkholderia sp. Tr-20355]MCA8041311.1 copper chaperone PCu(A)C [Burkholderia seminalis]
MKHPIPTALLVAVFALQAPASFAAPAVQADACWIRAMPATVPSSGYLTLKNDGDTPATLTGIDSPAYGMAMVHETQTNGSTAKMVHVDSVVVPAHGSLTFKPKSYHVMLEEPRKAVAPGSKVPFRLHFADGSTVSVTCDAKAPTYAGQ